MKLGIVPFDFTFFISDLVDKGLSLHSFGKFVLRVDVFFKNFI